MLRASVEALDIDQQRDIVKRVLRSAQFAQGLQTLTGALRDGGLPTVCAALGVDIEKGGYLMEGGGVPLGGGAAVEAFLDGLKKGVMRLSLIHI